jgi:hypothetical protein
MSDNQETGSLSVTQAANLFGSMMEPATATPEPVREEVANESEADAEDVGLEDTSEEFDSEDSSEDPEAGQEETDEADEEGSAQTYTVRVDGEEVQVTIDELLSGYSRTQDYTRKTMALADQRKSLEGELEQIRQERAQLSQVLEQIDVQDQEQEPNWDALYQQDPQQWLIQREVWRERQERKRALVEEKQRLLQAQEADKQRVISQFVQQEQVKLNDVLPQWRDEKVAKAEKAQVAEYAKKIGFTDQEIAQFYDHRAVTTLYKAMKFDELQSGKPKAAKKTAPVAKAGAANTTPKARDAYRKSQQRLAKTGKVADAAEAFKHLLG